ncbi:MAG: N-acetyltransferase [Planctomycetaceae bacterium]
MTLQTQRVDHRRLREAVDLHTSGLPDEFREETRSELLRHSRSGTTSFDHSRIVLSDSKVVACLLVERQRDSTWHFHLPVFAKCLESDTVQQLKQSLCAGLCEDFNQSDAWIAQTLISPDQSDDAIVLGETGFPVLTDLLFMGRPCHREIPDQTGSKTWPFETWSDTSEDLFAAIMESTYEGTRDCPELNGFRTGRHALRSHSLSGCFDPQLWRLYSDGCNAAGIALINPHSDGPELRSRSVWEIVYIGVARAFRNQGLGRRMLADLLASACVGDAAEVILGVDIRNAPAIRLYEQFGFQEFDRRRVHVRLRSYSDRETDAG